MVNGIKKYNLRRRIFHIGCNMGLWTLESMRVRLLAP
jgi:hypothetical protein